ncbi:MAG: hypothetical protein KC910_11420, partial [Candidatus Eremiobacteraeota bacterium]|nr:hypothetical protein [Candidatus Eremiobacteraeota bacterium]
MIRKTGATWGGTLFLTLEKSSSAPLQVPLGPYNQFANTIKMREKQNGPSGTLGPFYFLIKSLSVNSVVTQR